MFYLSTTPVHRKLYNLALVIGTLTGSSLALAALPVASPTASTVSAPGARTNGTSGPILTQIPTPTGVQLTSLAYDYATAAVGAPPHITIKIGGNVMVGQLSNCLVTLKVGTTVVNNFPISALPLSSGAVAPKDGESISFKAVSAGCVGEKSVIYKKPFVADPNFVGALTGISMGKAGYKDNENTSFTVVGNNGEAQCAAQLTVDGNYTMPIFINPFLPALKFPQTRTDLGKYKAGWHKVKIEGGPYIGMLPCKGSVTVDFKVDSSAANSPTLTSVQAQFAAPFSGFKVGSAQSLLINGTGLCKYRLVYKGVGPQSAYSWTSPIQNATPFPHTDNINPITTPGDYIVEAKPEGDCSGGSGAAFNVSMP